MAVLGSGFRGKGFRGFGGLKGYGPGYRGLVGVPALTLEFWVCFRVLHGFSGILQAVLKSSDLFRQAYRVKAHTRWPSFDMEISLSVL